MPAGTIHAPIKTDGLTAVFSGSEPVVDFGTGEMRTDRASGQAMYRAHLTVVLPGEVRPQVWSVSVPGEPKGIEPGQVVGISDLVATEWEIDGRHGIAFRASAIFPVSVQGRASKVEAA